MKAKPLIEKALLTMRPLIKIQLPCSIWAGANAAPEAKIFRWGTLNSSGNMAWGASENPTPVLDRGFAVRFYRILNVKARAKKVFLGLGCGGKKELLQGQGRAVCFLPVCFNSSLTKLGGAAHAS
jgi:hypothetical protein